MIIGINASYLSSKKKTGVENYASLLITALLNLDSSNTYYLFSPKYINKNKLPKNSNYEIFFSPFPRGWHRFRLPLSLLRHKVDLFFDPGYTVPPFITIPTIVTIHDLAHKHFPEVYTPAQINTLERAFRLAEKKAAGLVFPSHNTLIDFQKFYPQAKASTKVIYPGYDNDKFNQKVNRDILHLDVPYILFVGRLEAKKNIVNLIRAYVKIRHLKPEIKHKLVLAGMPGYGHDDIVKEIALNQKYGADILSIGYVSDSELPHLYSSADLFVFPSLYEGFGIPILESFASKTPVVAASSSCLPEVAGDAAFYFKPDDTDDMARSLIKAVTDQDTRKKHLSIGSQRLRQFTWDNYVTQFLGFARKVIDENSHRP